MTDLQRDASLGVVEPALGAAARRVDAEWAGRARVTARRQIADDVVLVTLTPLTGEALPAWQAGAHIDLDLPDGLTRQYSLCGDPDEGGVWQVAILKDPASRGGSLYIHDRLLPGTEVDVRGPRNHFELPPGEHYLLVAGGIGITPILAMARALERRSDSAWHLVYGGRSRATMAFVDEVERMPHTLVTEDEHGFIDLPGIVGAAAPGTTVLACGPGGLLAAVEEACETRPDLALVTERFAAEPTPEGAGGADTEFEVQLASSGRVLQVAADRTVLETVRAVGVSVTTSCTEGICGSCETGVLAGVPEHRDSVLTAEERAENDCMMLCVSRSVGGRLVLDL